MTKWQLELITLYCNVCKAYDSKLAAVAQRQSNNFRPKFTDEECITIYLWGIIKRKYTVKAVYQHTAEHLSDWFPKLPSYQLFNRRINYLSEAICVLCSEWMGQLHVDASVSSHLMDSMPVVLAKGTRSSAAKVAPELCGKSYCSSQKMWYYGVKLHLLGQKRFERLPVPIYMEVTPAAEHDLDVAKQVLPHFQNMELFVDKAYRAAAFEKELAGKNNIVLRSPVKLKKGQKELSSADKLYSKAISRTRQAIESLFAWIQEKTDIHRASKVRSSSGLLSFIFARLAVVCLLLSAYSNC